MADRLEGARRSLRRPGADAGDLLLIETAALSLAAGQQAGAQLAAMAAGRRPTAAFCVNDLVALGAAQQLARHQVRIPEDVALLGYDDIEFAATAAVPLSSVASPATSSGERPRSFSWRKRPPETVTSTTGISTTGTSIAR